MENYEDQFDAYYEQEKALYEYQSTLSQEEQQKLPYLMRRYVVYERRYNKVYGDDRVCTCGHPYYRHFDTYEDMSTTGCKYCFCGDFKEKS